MAGRRMLKIAMPAPYDVAQAFKEIPRNIAATCMGAAVRRAMAPCLQKLKSLTPKGPTGNLFRAARIKSVKYPKSGTGVAVVGYEKAGQKPSKSAGGGSVKKGSDRGFHQFFLEKGTKNRKIETPAVMPYARSSRAVNKQLRKALGAKQARELKDQVQAVRRQGGYIASSFLKLGPFKFTQSKKNLGVGRVSTSPKYPKAFFKKSKNPIDLGPMIAQHPVERAWDATRPEVMRSLEGEMEKALENAKKILADRAARANQMADLGKYL
jgi:hypothetical protein